jgi:hypothetical protein
MKQTFLLAPAAVVLALTHGCSDSQSLAGNGPYLDEMKWINLPAGVTKLTSADLSGRAVMMEFWATW